VAVAVGVLALGVAHGVVLVALRARRPFASSAALLLCATMATMLLGLAVAAATTAVTAPEQGGSFVLAAVGALAGAVAYGVATAQLIGEVRARRHP
jgi:hypothetical protein